MAITILVFCSFACLLPVPESGDSYYYYYIPQANISELEVSKNLAMELQCHALIV